jgi:hypothetical protein
MEKAYLMPRKPTLTYYLHILDICVNPEHDYS